MHSAVSGPPHGERASGVPRMQQPLWRGLRRRLRRLQVIFAAATACVPLFLLEHEWQPGRRCRRLPPHRKAALVRCGFSGVLHA